MTDNLFEVRPIIAEHSLDIGELKLDVKALRTGQTELKIDVVTAVEKSREAVVKGLVAVRKDIEKLDRSVNTKLTTLIVVMFVYACIVAALVVLG